MLVQCKSLRFNISPDDEWVNFDLNEKITSIMSRVVFLLDIPEMIKWSVDIEWAFKDIMMNLYSQICVNTISLEEERLFVDSQTILIELLDMLRVLRGFDV